MVKTMDFKAPHFSDEAVTSADAALADEAMEHLSVEAREGRWDSWNEPEGLETDYAGVPVLRGAGGRGRGLQGRPQGFAARCGMKWRPDHHNWTYWDISYAILFGSWLSADSCC